MNQQKRQAAANRKSKQTDQDTDEQPDYDNLCDSFETTSLVDVYSSCPDGDPLSINASKELRIGYFDPPVDMYFDPKAIASNTNIFKSKNSFHTNDYDELDDESDLLTDHHEIEIDGD